MRALTPTSSPLSSPSKHGDRFIPSRAGANWSVNFHRINVSLREYTQGCAEFPIKRTVRSRFACRRFTDTAENKSSVYHFVLQEIEKSHNQNRKTKDGTADNNKGN